MSEKWITTLSILCIAISICAGCRKNEDNNIPVPVTGAYTTLDRTIVPDEVPDSAIIKPWDIALFSKYGYGKWHYGPGNPYQKKLHLMPYGYTGASATNTTSLLNFFAITDIHITDKESPTQSIYYSFIPWMFKSAISCYSPAMLYSTHTLDAAIQSINNLQKQSKFDFGLTLGDMANSSMYNETRWFIDILDGKIINPDSGKDDDPIAGPGNDYQDEFQATGLDKSIPWYATMGNHDHFLMGADPFNDRIRNNATSSEILRLGNVFVNHIAALDEETFSMGTLDGSTRYGNIIGAGVVAEMTSFPVIPSDPDRRILAKNQTREEFFNTGTLPSGHGFNCSTTLAGCYTFEPKAELPLRVIVIDDTQDETDVPVTGVYGAGSLANGREAWLLAQLEAGQQEGKLMIIAAHVPIGVEPNGSMLGWYPDQVEENRIIAELKKYPNLILWASGHRHRSQVTAFASDDPDHPENGFWEVETKSLKEFPQQFRTFRIVSNNDNTLSIFVTNVDTEVSNNPLAAVARSYAIAAAQLYGIMDITTENDWTGKNYELIVPLSTEMQSKIEAYRVSGGK
jgi:metallophosphoesterase (TIGR03768 family)